MHARFFAVLLALGLGAGGALVGMTMATGTWTVVGSGLAPGEAYALRLGADGDRFRLDLANASADAVATFSVYGPSGERAGYYAVDAGMRSVEVAAGEGIWLVFVYKAQGGDLVLASHGATNASGELKVAKVERREVVLGHYASQQQLNASYTAILDAEPALAGVYLKGSAKALQSELRTEKGVVEVVNDEEVNAAAAGVFVEVKSERATMPENLAKGPFTARVSAERLSGTLLLVSLHVAAPEFPAPAPPPPAPAPGNGTAPPSSGGESPPPGTGTEPRSAPPPIAAPQRPAPSVPAGAFTSCGTIDSRVAYVLTVGAATTMRLTLHEQVDPWVTVFDPQDNVLKAVELRRAGDQASVALSAAGEYVVYARGATVLVEMQDVQRCAVRALAMAQHLVATVKGEALLDSGGNATFTLPKPPLEFVVRLAGAGASAFGMQAVFTGPAGAAATLEERAGAGLLAGLGLGSAGTHEASAHLMPEAMVAGAWLLEVQAQMMQGDLEAYAVQYTRGEAGGAASAGTSG